MTSAYLDRPTRSLEQLAAELRERCITTPRDLDAWEAAAKHIRVLAEIAARKR